MRTTIYRDDQRTLEMDEHGRFVATNARGQSLYVDLADETTTLIDTLPPGTSKFLIDRGDDPQGWYALVSHGQPRAVLPPQSRQAMTLAITTAQAERRQIINDPANVERRRITALFSQAHRLQNDPGRYFPALITAEQALNAWREQYPAAATRERRQTLSDEADDLERKAKGALLYDADGSLSAAERQARHDAWMAEAQAKRAEAANL